MRILGKIFTCASLLGLSACASIIEGSTDHINVSTSPATQSTCSMTNSRGTVTAYTPSSAAIKKSKSDINISCSDPRTGATGQSTVVSDIEAWDFGNILIGGLVGMGVDWYTGAAYDYPDSAVVPMAVPTAAYPAPAYAPAAATAAPTYPAPAMSAAPISNTPSSVYSPNYAPQQPATNSAAPFGAPTQLQPLR